ncbi:MAG: hypothetical protein OXN83_03505 [Oligoflexia bacterium]|nr:hypothetical protein [Oligoflexia bacterium]
MPKFNFKFDEFTQKCWEEIPDILKEYMEKDEKYFHKKAYFIRNNVRVLWTLYNHIKQNYKISSTAKLSTVSKVHNEKMLVIQEHWFEIGLLKRYFLSPRFFMGCAFNNEVCQKLSIPTNGYHIFIFMHKNKTQVFNPNEEWIKLPNFIKKKEIKILSPAFFRFTNYLLKELQKIYDRRCSFYHDNIYNSHSYLNTLMEYGVIVKISKPLRKRRMVHMYDLTHEAAKNLLEEKWGIYSENI